MSAHPLIVAVACARCLIVQPGGGGDRREAKSKTKSAQQRFEIRSERSPKNRPNFSLGSCLQAFYRLAFILGAPHEAFLSYFCSPVPVLSQASPPFLTHFETARHCVRRKGHAKIKQHRLVAVKLYTAWGLHVGIAPVLPPVLSEEYIIESFLQDTIRAHGYVFIFLLRSK